MKGNGAMRRKQGKDSRQNWEFKKHLSSKISHHLLIAFGVGLLLLGEQEKIKVSFGPFPIQMQAKMHSKLQEIGKLPFDGSSKPSQSFSFKLSPMSFHNLQKAFTKTADHHHTRWAALIINMSSGGELSFLTSDSE